MAMAASAASTAASAASTLKGNNKNIVPEIKEIIEVCETKTAGIMQPSVDKIVNLCLESGLAVKRTILGRNCGIHPASRGKMGVGPICAQKLMLQISKQGYSETRLENPMGFGKALEGDLHDEQAKFNAKKNRGGRRLS